MLALILGDPHIGKGTTIGKNGVGTGLNSRIVDQIKLLDWTLEQAIERHVKHIIITGDIFDDHRPGVQLISIFIDWLLKCNTSNITVHILPGNHDIYSSNNFYISPLDLIEKLDLDSIKVYKNINTFFIDTTAFTLIPFRDRKSLNAETNSIGLSLIQNQLTYELLTIPVTYTKIAVGHLAIEGSIPVGDEIDDIANEIFCPISMFNEYDFVWMGHVHKPQVMSKSNPYVAHIGSMDISNFLESDEKKKIVIYDTDEKTFIEVDLPTRPLRKISITVPKDTVDTTQFVIDEISKKYTKLNKAIVKIEISLASPELLSIDRVKVKKFLYDQSIFHIAGFSESKKISLIKKDKLESIDTTMDVSSAINTWADKRFTKEETLKKNKFIEVANMLISKLKLEGKE